MGFDCIHCRHPMHHRRAIALKRIHKGANCRNTCTNRTEHGWQ